MHRLLDSILTQTYRPIEFILVNDGSTDSSAEVWSAYEPRFDAAGIKHQYIYQENQGLGAAINAGLQAFTGAYFCWPDIDDYLEGTSIEKRVAFLEENPEYGSVSSDAYEFLEEDLEHPIGTVAGWMKHIREPWQFRYMLQGQSVYCSGCHMLRTSCFLKVNPSRRIYPARRGQIISFCCPFIINISMALLMNHCIITSFIKNPCPRRIPVKNKRWIVNGNILHCSRQPYPELIWTKRPGCFAASRCGRSNGMLFLKSTFALAGP